MKKLGILNRELARILASMGHTDSLVIADCGLPIPPGVECIDLSLILGQPSFADTLAAVLADFQCERAVFAEELLTHNAELSVHSSHLSQQGCLVTFIPHQALKTLTQQSRVIIRTGEASPYANVVLYSGVIF